MTTTSSKTDNCFFVVVFFLLPLFLLSLTFTFPPLPLCSNTEKIQSGIGDKSALFLQYMTTFVAGFVIAFVKSWKLSLVLASVAPVLVGAGIATSKVRPC